MNHPVCTFCNENPGYLVTFRDGHACMMCLGEYGLEHSPHVGQSVFLPKRHNTEEEYAYQGYPLGDYNGWEGYYSGEWEPVIVTPFRSKVTIQELPCNGDLESGHFYYIYNPAPEEQPVTGRGKRCKVEVELL